MMPVTNILWLYRKGYALEYRKSPKDKWKPWKPAKGYNVYIRVSKKCLKVDKHMERR